jgi:hypothetical protein
MDDASLAAWLLEREARALLTRLDRIQPFALQDTMVPAAAILPKAAAEIEGYLVAGRRQLRSRVLEFIGWIRGPGRGADPAEAQHRFTIIRLRFNAVLAQLDVFAEALSQRSEAGTGVWLSGLDLAAQDALRLREHYYEAPPVICYLHRGFGGAIRRAHTRLPGGETPVSIIRVPRERMIGYGIASSLVHETGHQAAALLGLTGSLRAALRAALRAETDRCPASRRVAWRLFERWISEIIADFWAVAKLGVASTLGLMGIVSLPRAFVFRMNADDPHPFPWFRVKLSCAIGDALYPDPQWRRVAGLWERLYPVAGLAPPRVEVIELLDRMTGPFVSLLTGHRPPALRGRSLQEAISIPHRTPQRLAALYEQWLARPGLMLDAAPTLVFAVFGQARATGRLSPEQENRKLGELIKWWAMRTTPNGAYTGGNPRAVMTGRRPPVLADAMSGEEPWK